MDLNNNEIEEDSNLNDASSSNTQSKTETTSIPRHSLISIDDIPSMSEMQVKAKKLFVKAKKQFSKNLRYANF